MRSGGGIITTGNLVVSDTNFGAGYVCSLKLMDRDGFYSAIDLSPSTARTIGLQLLERAGVVATFDAKREALLGARQ